MKAMIVEDEPEDPAIITMHARRVPSRRSTQDELKDIYGPQSPPAYISTIDGLVCRLCMVFWFRFIILQKNSVY